MSEITRADEPIAVILRSDGGSRTWKGTTAGCSSNAVAAVLESPGFPAGDGQVLVVAGVRGSRRFAPAAFVRVHGGAHIFRLLGEWRPFDVRASKRFRVDLPAQVTALLGGARHEGRVMDVSAGGMAVAVQTSPVGRDLEVALVFDGYGAHLPCRLVGAELWRSGQLLHLQFAALTIAQQAFIRNLLALLRQQEHYLERLAS